MILRMELRGINFEEIMNRIIMLIIAMVFFSCNETEIVRNDRLLLSAKKIEMVMVYKASSDKSFLKRIENQNIIKDIVEQLESGKQEFYKFKPDYWVELISGSDTNIVLVGKDLIKYKGVSYKMSSTFNEELFQ